MLSMLPPLRDKRLSYFPPIEKFRATQYYVSGVLQDFVEDSEGRRDEGWNFSFSFFIFRFFEERNKRMPDFWVTGKMSGRSGEGTNLRAWSCVRDTEVGSSFPLEEQSYFPRDGDHECILFSLLLFFTLPTSGKESSSSRGRFCRRIDTVFLVKRMKLPLLYFVHRDMRRRERRRTLAIFRNRILYLKRAESLFLSFSLYKSHIF